LREANVILAGDIVAPELFLRFVFKDKSGLREED